MESLVPNLQLPPAPLTRGLSPPDPRSYCPLSLTEFVELPAEQNSWVRHWFQMSIKRLSIIAEHRFLYNCFT